MIKITTIEEYNLCIKEDVEPLIDPRFEMNINLRKQVQNDLFTSMDKYYRWCWFHSPDFCEECGCWLVYSAEHISHILSRGAHPAMKHDPRNMNILCFIHHTRWDFGDKDKMNIYDKNQLIIQTLKSQYYVSENNFDRQPRERRRAQRSGQSECNQSQRSDDGEVDAGR